MGVARVQAHFLFGPWASLETTIFCPQNHTAPNSSKIYVGLGYRHLNVRKDKIMDQTPTILFVFFFFFFFFFIIREFQHMAFVPDDSSLLSD